MFWQWTPVDVDEISQIPPLLADYTLTAVHGGALLLFGGQHPASGSERYTLNLSAFVIHLFDEREKLCRRSLLPDASLPRFNHSACSNADGSIVFVFGGQTSVTGAFLNDLVEFRSASSSWVRVEVAGNAPSPRAEHASVLGGSAMFVFGGRTVSGKLLNDLYFLDVETKVWHTVSAASLSGLGPTPRVRAALAVNVNESVDVEELLVVGGCGRHSKLQMCDAFKMNLSHLQWMRTPVLTELAAGGPQRKAIVDGQFVGGEAQVAVAAFPSLLCGLRCAGGAILSDPPRRVASALQSGAQKSPNDAPPLVLNGCLWCLRCCSVVSLCELRPCETAQDGCDAATAALSSSSYVNEAPQYFHRVADIWITIFGFLSPEDVCRAARICHHAHLAAIDDLLWSRGIGGGVDQSAAAVVSVGRPIAPRQQFLHTYQLMGNVCASRLVTDAAGRPPPLLPLVVFSTQSRDSAPRMLHVGGDRLLLVAPEDSVTLLNIGGCFEAGRGGAKKMAIHEEPSAGGSQLAIQRSNSSGGFTREDSTASAQMCRSRSSSSTFVTNHVQADPIAACNWAADPSSLLVAFGTMKSHIVVVDASTGVVTAHLKGHTRHTSRLEWIDKGSLVSGSYDCTLRLWDVQSQRQVHNFTSHTQVVDHIFCDVGTSSAAHTDLILSLSRPFPGGTPEAIFHDAVSGSLVQSVTTLPRTASGFFQAQWSTRSAMFMMASDLCILYDATAHTPAANIPPPVPNGFFSSLCRLNENVFACSGGVRRTFDAGFLWLFDVRKTSSTSVCPVDSLQVADTTATTVIPLLPGEIAVAAGPQVMSCHVNERCAKFVADDGRSACAPRTIIDLKQPAELSHLRLTHSFHTASSRIVSRLTASDDALRVCCVDLASRPPQPLEISRSKGATVPPKLPLAPRRLLPAPSSVSQPHASHKSITKVVVRM